MTMDTGGRSASPGAITQRRDALDVRRGTPAQLAAWSRLWSWLLADDKEEAAGVVQTPTAED